MSKYPSFYPSTLMRLACNVLLVLLIAGVLVIFLAARAYPTLAGYETVEIRGRSQGDNPPLGALAFIRPQDRYTIGDVVTFRAANGEFVSHRLVDTWSGDPHGPLFQSKGDANVAADAVLVDTSEIVGRVEMWIPWLGILAAMLSTLPVIAFLMILAALLLYLPSSPRASRSR